MPNPCTKLNAQGRLARMGNRHLACDRSLGGCFPWPVARGLQTVPRNNGAENPSACPARRTPSRSRYRSGRPETNRGPCIVRRDASRWFGRITGKMPVTLLEGTISLECSSLLELCWIPPGQAAKRCGAFQALGVRRWVRRSRGSPKPKVSLSPTS